MCSPFLEVVPSIAGAASFVLPTTGAVLTPARGAGFSFEIPDINVAPIAAKLDATSSAVTIKVFGSFPVLSNWATFTEFLITETTSSRFRGTATFGVPDLNLVGATCTLQYDGTARTYSFTFTTDFTPVANVRLRGASLTFQSGVGMVMTTSGTIVSTPITASLVVADSGAKARGAPALNFTGKATEVAAASVLGSLFPNTPQPILSLLSPIRFDEIVFTYDSTAFGVIANPDLSGVPGLGQIISYLGFTQRMSLPFLEPSNINVALAATVSYDSTAPPPSISFILSASVSAATSTPFTIKGFPWIGINYIGGSVGLTALAAPPFVSIRNIDYAARGVVLGAEVAVAMLYDQPKALFAVQFTLQNLDLQNMIRQMGINVDLGPFNIAIQQASFSYANQPVTVGPTTIPAGLALKASMTFLTIPFQIGATVNTDGFTFSASTSNVLQSFGFSFSATIFGIRIEFSVGFSLSTPPWDQFVEKLKTDILKPLTAACTKHTYARGTKGLVCPSGTEQQGLLCYPFCPTGWEYGNYGKLNICYQNCPPGYRDDGVDGTGLSCSYVGCNPTTQIQDEIGGLCYDKCDAGYTYRGATCYKNCDPGWSESGDVLRLSCTQNFCNSGDEDNGAGICYPSCRDGYHSNKLTMCIANSCPSGCTCYKDAQIIGKTYDRGVGYAKFRSYLKSSYPARNPVSSIKTFWKKTQWRQEQVMVCPSDTDI
ncbi:hypothetical protein HYH03_015543 [Edaphochlamys debaryana]|uniref:Uncharacterized protein n=1 Tax=Edaphochlamys debaryana TaxID=47281 RepID=A0A835XTM3_9CHLO|nr:hypothetical protein HYH03_015543 [Edaphochlamys debaryana]|eukprot:KAG2485734.1 hypothetical protein HYH03_015543 [Edaphochlamys debaryana]